MKLFFSTIILFLVSMNVFPQDKDSIMSKFIKNNFKEKLYELENKELPKFELSTLTGRSITSKSLKGKPTLINFWFTNCTPCIEEIPLLNEIKDKYKNQVNFISITFENKKDINSFLEKNIFNFTHIIDSKSYINELGIMTYPKTVILDKNLIIKYIVGIKPKGVKKEDGKSVFKQNILDELVKVIEY